MKYGAINLESEEERENNLTYKGRQEEHRQNY